MTSLALVSGIIGTCKWHHCQLFISCITVGYMCIIVTYILHQCRLYVASMSLICHINAGYMGHQCHLYVASMPVTWGINVTYMSHQCQLYGGMISARVLWILCFCNRSACVILICSHGDISRFLPFFPPICACVMTDFVHQQCNVV